MATSFPSEPTETTLSDGIVELRMVLRGQSGDSASCFTEFVSRSNWPQLILMRPADRGRRPDSYYQRPEQRPDGFFGTGARAILDEHDNPAAARLAIGQLRRVVDGITPFRTDGCDHAFSPELREPMLAYLARVAQLQHDEHAARFVADAATDPNSSDFLMHVGMHGENRIAPSVRIENGARVSVAWVIVISPVRRISEMPTLQEEMRTMGVRSVSDLVTHARTEADKAKSAPRNHTGRSTPLSSTVCARRIRIVRDYWYGDPGQ
ncbi:MAG: hypothetical protein IPK60_11770 [Sandaracinaceae bacterium]|nr:hypothetical protein [Sandaracinaceae bacterium]